MTFGVDYAWGRPRIRALQTAGVQFAARYLSHDTTGKNLDPAEARALSDAGIWIVVVWESNANRALDGYDAGAQDARDADAQAAACGMPAGRPIYFAVDFDAGSGDQGAINSYLDGAASVLGHGRVGIYGGYYPVKRALDGGHATWGWQTYAWSGGKWDGRAQLQQYSNDHIIDGVGLDYDRATKDDYGQWQVGASPSSGPQPQHQPQEEDDMPVGDVKNGTAESDLSVIALPRGRYKSLGLIADNGFQGLLPASLRIAIHTTDDQGKGHWDVHKNQVVASDAGQFVIWFKDQVHTDGISIHHETDTEVADKTKVDVQGAVNVSYEIS